AGALGNFVSPPTLLALLGLLLTAMLMLYRIKGAMLLGILITAAVGVVVHAALRVPLSVVPGALEMPAQIVSVPDFRYVGSGIFGLSFLTRGGAAAALAGVLATFTLMLS